MEQSKRSCNFTCPPTLCLEKKVEAMTVLLLRQVRLFSNTLMTNGHSKKLSYGTEYAAKMDVEKGLCNAGE